MIKEVKDNNIDTNNDLLKMYSNTITPIEHLSVDAGYLTALLFNGFSAVMLLHRYVTVQ